MSRLDNLTPTQLRRLGEIGEALESEYGKGNVTFADPADWELDPPNCGKCGCRLEAGHCYCCQPVFGYGERFKVQRHSEQP